MYFCNKKRDPRILRYDKTHMNILLFKENKMYYIFLNTTYNLHKKDRSHFATILVTFGSLILRLTLKCKYLNNPHPK